ncbi:MAG: DNA polymerase II large subunit [Candidatus Micrarchaeota archaeon]|nr:DNA polymerase II large subunit [Candidatus Micrarchaeota archaeon]
MIVCSEGMKKYFDSVSGEFDKAFALAVAARQKGLDPSTEVEVSPAHDVAARVEGLVGPKGVGNRIREMLKEMNREQAAFQLAKEIITGPFFFPDKEKTGREKLIEQAVRTGLALVTEGVVSAPIEGISRVKARKNQDGSECLAVYFAGPIRGAGGTGQAFTLLIADYCRQLAGFSKYRPNEDEVERYVEETNLYALRTRAGQYVPTKEEVAWIARNCPVCIDGEPTEDYEVSVRKNVFGVETNRVRGGLCLVIAEGLCLKAAKVFSLAKKAGLDWSWIQNLIKVSKQEAERVELKPVEKYIDEIVAGRPIFSYPMAAGGFRLRYGRTRFTGIASKAISPATMVILDEFPAIGTQVKIERPGKGCIVTPCDSIDGPIVKLADGEVRQVNSIAEAEEVKDKVVEILFLGDLLVNYGDFLKANHPLAPGAWCIEWLERELEKAGAPTDRKRLEEMGFDEALRLAKEKGVSLHPKYTFFWHDLSPAQLKELAEWLCTGKMVFDWFEFKKLEVPADKRKRLLELLGVPHRVAEGNAVVEKDYALALLNSLGLTDGKTLSMDAFNKAWADDKEALATVNALAGVKVRKKAGVYIGASMGRPEKAKERKMQPPVHTLFPVGMAGGKFRSITRAAKNGQIEVEAASLWCPACGKRTVRFACPACGQRTHVRRKCDKCGKPVGGQPCQCGGKSKGFEKQVIDLAKMLEAACATVEAKPDEIKGVMGLVSGEKAPEALEKGVLRARHDIHVFRDGTCRFDATEVPVTHFKPGELAACTLEKLGALGYEKDVAGKPIENADQVVELKPQDIILAKSAAEFFLRVASFIDDLLVYYYKLPAYYNAKKAEDLVGKQVIALAPHTSAGIIARIIGFTDIRGFLAHPYLHCATRRNCDGDELCAILLLDALLNFSKAYLPETRGGRMDAPLVLTTVMDPSEVDNEAHAMDVCWKYPVEFYEATERTANPAEVKLDTVASRLEKPEQYEGIGFTHDASIAGPVQTRYVQLKNMPQKVKEELNLMMKIRAVNAADAAERIILCHFFPDLYGNLRSFSKQKFRCVDCNASYRRPPLAGKCVKPNCGGKLLLTINKGGIEKYLKLSISMADEYNLPAYLKQRLIMLEKEIKSVFQEDSVKQFSLADYA